MSKSSQPDKLTHNLASKLRSVVISTTTKPAQSTSSGQTADQIRAQLQAKLAQLKSMGVAVPTQQPAATVSEVWECLSCWDPVKSNTFLCEDCNNGTKKW